LYYQLPQSICIIAIPNQKVKKIFTGYDFFTFFL
jgi:hypothetical protein